MTVKEALELLPTHQFLQVHRSYIINLKLVEKVERHLVLIADYIIPISSSYFSDLKEKLKGNVNIKL